MAVAPPRPLAEGDNLGEFDCGREALNVWLRRHAWANHVNGMSRVNVIEDIEGRRGIGFVSLNASQRERAFLPKARQRNSPDPIPVTLLGRLAVDKAYQGQRHAASLLEFALLAAWRASAEVASFGVLTHPLDEDVRGFYARWGFEELPFDPKRAMLVRMADIAAALHGQT